MKPVTDALYNWIKTFVVHKTFKCFKLYMIPTDGQLLGVYYSMVYGTVPELHHNSQSELLAFHFSTDTKENKIKVRVVLAKPSVMSTRMSYNDEFCCENLTCKDIITITEYVKKNYTKKIMEIYYYNPADFKHPENPIDDFKRLYPRDYNLANGFIEGCKSLINKIENTNKKKKEIKLDFRKEA